MAYARVEPAWLRRGRVLYFLWFVPGFVGFVFAEYLTSDIQMRMIESRFDPEKISVAGGYPFVNNSLGVGWGQRYRPNVVCYQLYDLAFGNEPYEENEPTSLRSDWRA